MNTYEFRTSTGTLVREVQGTSISVAKDYARVLNDGELVAVAPFQGGFAIVLVK
jgi:hypothetical protein